VLIGVLRDRIFSERFGEEEEGKTELREDEDEDPGVKREREEGKRDGEC
jgi:hypothetical protein